MFHFGMILAQVFTLTKIIILANKSFFQAKIDFLFKLIFVKFDPLRILRGRIFRNLL